MRRRAQEILTRELGRRSERDVSDERAVEIGREAFTEIDRVITGEEASRYQVLRPDDAVPVVDGVVLGIGLHDELSGEMFAAIRTSSGAGYYLRLPAHVAQTLQERDAVRLGFEVEPWLKPADRIVARAAQENGGIYDPVLHQRALEGLRQPGSHQPGQPSPAERVGANIRRLERLARYRLVSRLADAAGRFPSIFWPSSKTVSGRIRRSDSA